MLNYIPSPVFLSDHSYSKEEEQSKEKPRRGTLSLDVFIFGSNFQPVGMRQWRMWRHQTWTARVQILLDWITFQFWSGHTFRSVLGRSTLLSCSRCHHWRLGVALGVSVSPLAIRRSASRCCPRRFAAWRLCLALGILPWCIISVCTSLHSMYQYQSAFGVPISVPWYSPAKMTFSGVTYQSAYPGEKQTVIQYLCFFCRCCASKYA